MAGFELTLYGRIWVTPKEQKSVLSILLQSHAKVLQFCSKDSPA